MQKFTKDEHGIWINHAIKKVNYPTYGNTDSFNLEKNSFWFKHRNSVISSVIERFSFFGAFADVGGGSGYQIQHLSKKFRNKKFILVEPGYTGCLYAKKRGIQEVFNTTFDDFPIQNYTVGGIGSFDVLEHIEDELAFLQKMSKKCQKNTLIYLTVPTYSWLWSDVDDYTKHFRRYNKTHLKKLAKNCNLEFVYSSYFFSYLPIPIFLFRGLPYRLYGRKRHGRKIIETENKQHTLGKLASQVIDSINTWELKQIIKKRIYFGSSCIAVFKTRH